MSSGKLKQWVVFNTETKSLEDIGTELEMRQKASKMNGWYHTDAYSAREYKDA